MHGYFLEVGFTLQSIPSDNGKTLFLTSSPFLGSDFNPANRFTARLTDCFSRGGCSGLFIASDPHDANTELYSRDVRQAMEKLEIGISGWNTLLNKNADEAPNLVRQANFIILGGGHVPTQNRFFQRIRLKELLQDWQGVILGISAGSMNSAETVYAQP